MKLFAIQCVVVVFLASICQTSLAEHDAEPNVFEVDLRAGYRSRLIPGLKWQTRLTRSQSRCLCDRQGVLKLTFSPLRKRAEINMTFEYSRGWTFHVGDSVTNDGYEGDAGTQNNDAEVHSVNNNIFFFGRDNPAGGSYGLLHSHPNFMGVQPYTTVTLNIADELATADNGAKFLYINSYKLFALKGQSDTAPGGVNRDVYLAMNRVVSSPFRKGTGLCRVRVRFYPF